MKPAVPLTVVLVLACGAQLMVVLDGLIVTVALPQMRSGLHLSPAGQEWIVNGYLITLGGLLLLAARAADLIGHRRIFLVGLAVFTLASLAGGVARDGTTLIVARFVQGAGAAALAPSSLSLLTTTHTDAHRVRALSIWSATSGSAGALGLVLGGAITSGLGWRWVLLVNVPIGLALWITAARCLTPARPDERQRVDILGAITITAGVACLTYAITQAEQSGWASAQVTATLVAAVGLVMLFVGIEHRSDAPLVPLAILRHRNLVTADIVIAAIGAVMTATVYFLSLYLQNVLGYSPVRTGLALVPMSAILTAGAIGSKRLLPLFGVRRLITIGGLIMAAGLAWLATITGHSSYLQHILDPTLVWAAGASIVVMPCIALATSDVDPTQAGLASGLVNTARQVGGAIGLAALATLASTATTHSDASLTADRAAHGYSTAFLVAAAIAVLLAVGALAARTPAPRQARQPQQAPGSTPR